MFCLDSMNKNVTLSCVYTIKYILSVKVATTDFGRTGNQLTNTLFIDFAHNLLDCVQHPRPLYQWYLSSFNKDKNNIV